MNNIQPDELWYESSSRHEDPFLNFAISNCDVKSDSDRKNILSISLDLKTGEMSYNVMLSNEAFAYSSVLLT